MLVAAEAVDERAVGPRSPGPKRAPAAVLLETFLLTVSPVVLFFALRLRPMAPYHMPDPAMHTAYVISPRDLFARFSSELTVVAGSREGARVGFLVPARLSYLAFGAVPGFFVFRYVLALVTIVPAYILMRRLYSRSAGVMTIFIFMSSPVIVTAWGTDYPDSAIVSYLTAALACLAMPSREQRRPAWLAAAACLFTLAVWSNAAAAPLVAGTMLAYLAVCVLRRPRRLLFDVLVLAATAAAVTGALMLASGLLLGPFDYIAPTIKAYRYLNRPVIVKRSHSTNPRWILLRPYLLVPAAAVTAWGVTFLRRLGAVPTPQLLIGTACAAQIAAFGYLQFLGNAEVLQQHYYSSGLWAAVSLVLAITVAALAKPLLDHRLASFIPAAIVLALAFVDEAAPHVPAFGWWPTGLLIVVAVIVAAGVVRLVSKAGPPAARSTAAAVVVVVLGCSLILTVAPYEHHAPLSGVINNPVPAYSTALGGSDGNLVDQYRVATELPQFVGDSTFPGERLLMWSPSDEELVEVQGMYHDGFNSLPSPPTVLTPADRYLLHQRKPAEVLVFDAPDFPATFRLLAPYDPTLLRATVLGSGDFVLHAWLISLGTYMRRHQS